MSDEAETNRNTKKADEVCGTFCRHALTPLATFIRDVHERHSSTKARKKAREEDADVIKSKSEQGERDFLCGLVSVSKVHESTQEFLEQQKGFSDLGF